jgi:hypothetical protein
MLDEISGIEDDRDSAAEELFNKTMASTKKAVALFSTVGRGWEEVLAQSVAFYNNAGHPLRQLAAEV